MVTGHRLLPLINQAKNGRLLSNGSLPSPSKLLRLGGTGLLRVQASAQSAIMPRSLGTYLPIALFEKILISNWLLALLQPLPRPLLTLPLPLLPLPPLLLGGVLLLRTCPPRVLHLRDSWHRWQMRNRTPIRNFVGLG